MRILHINSSKSIGGGEIHTLNLVNGLLEGNQTVFLACRTGSKLASMSQAQKISTLELDLKNSLDFISTIKLAKFCKKNNIDVIHAHLARDYWIAYITKLLYKRAKLVFTRHVSFPIKSTLLKKKMYKSTDKIIAVASAVEKSLLDSGVVIKEKISVIYNGIDVSKINNAVKNKLRKELDLNNDAVIIGTIGSFCPNKDQLTFIKSIPDIINKIPNAVFVIIGSGDENYKKELDELVKKLGLTGKVRFLGARSDIYDLIKDFNVFLLTSKQEGFPLVIIEAMAAGVPVISTNVGGISEVIKNNETGILIPPESPKELSKAVIELLSDKKLTKDIIDNAQIAVNKHFTVENMTSNTLNIYKQVMESKKQ